MVSDTLNIWATFRFALSYPDERHHDRFAALGLAIPTTLEELRAQYIQLFEAGLPQPKCPLLESAYVSSHPPGEIVLENKMFYQNFGLKLDSRAAPDHLLTQLEFLAWIDHCIRAQDADSGDLPRARREFLDRHLANWLSTASRLARRNAGGCYAAILKSLSMEVERYVGPLRTSSSAT